LILGANCASILAPSALDVLPLHFHHFSPYLTLLATGLSQWIQTVRQKQRKGVSNYAVLCHTQNSQQFVFNKSMSVSYIHVTFQYFTVIKVHQIPMRGVHYRAQSTLNDLASKQVYRRRYERRRSPKPKLH